MNYPNDQSCYFAIRIPPHWHLVLLLAPRSVIFTNDGHHKHKNVLLVCHMREWLITRGIPRAGWWSIRLGMDERLMGRNQLLVMHGSSLRRRQSTIVFPLIRDGLVGLYAPCVELCGGEALTEWIIRDYRALWKNLISFCSCWMISLRSSN